MCVRLCSCKTLHEISSYPSVLKRVSLAKFSPVPWKQEVKTFLERCTNAENPEALYRTGMVRTNSVLAPVTLLLYCTIAYT